MEVYLVVVRFLNLSVVPSHILYRTPTRVGCTGTCLLVSSETIACWYELNCLSLFGLGVVLVFAAPRSSLSDYVLGEFSGTEKKELDNVIAEACDAVEHWVEEEDMGKVMTRVNSR